MGLSNEERIHKAIWAANRITKIGNKLKPESDDFDNFETRYVVEHLKKLCLEVIPTMSSSKGNSLFWIVGADMEVGFSKTTLWSLALHDKIKNAMTPEARKEIKERDEKKEDMRGKELRKEDQNLFEPDGYLSEQQKHVYDIYLWCQQFMYASNRYDDELSASYSEVNGKLSLILNECFNIFNMEKGYAIAYLKSKVFPFLLGCKKYDKYEDWDELTRYIIKNHRQYSFKNYGDKWDEFLLDTLKCWWIDLETKPTIKNRFWIWMKLFENFGTIDSKSDEKGLKELCEKIGIKYEGKVSRMVERGKTNKKERESSWSSNYQATKDYDKEDLQERRTDAFHFIWNSED